MSGGSGVCSRTWTANCSGRRTRARCRSSGARWSGTSMLSLGLDLSERPVRAVVVDEAGEVLARGTGASAGEAAGQARGDRAPETGGIAIFNDSKDAADVPGLTHV